MKYYLIENKPDRAKYFESLGVDYIFIDLEKLGKEERQANMDTVKSHHSVADITKVKSAISHSKVLVRIDPINDNTGRQIEEVLNAGADAIMLPFFMTAHEVSYFIEKVAGRAETILLLEHIEPLNNIQDILKVEGIDKIHFGLNDLSISIGYDFMFKVLAEELLNDAIHQCKEVNLDFGIGGIGPLNSGRLPGKIIMDEYIRLGASATIISRTMVKLLDQNKQLFENELQALMEHGESAKKDVAYYEKNLGLLKTLV